MIQRAIIYTTSRGSWIEERLPYIIECLNKTSGRTVESIDVEPIDAPRNVETFKDLYGDTRFYWDWFQKKFTAQAKGYNVVIFHFTRYYKDKWELSRRIDGTYRNDPDPFMEFWICADKNEEAKGYDFDYFTRVMLHEWAHGDSYFGRILIPWELHPRDLVHKWDYELKDIHRFPEQITYADYNIRIKIIALLEKTIDLIYKYAKIKN